jgi:Ser/Thr protein kinase RdoA (MazF antagonist)
MNEKILERAAAGYGISPERLTPLPGGHFSHVYEFSKGDQDCILRITPPGEEIDGLAMRAILDWVDFLSAHGAPVAGPILSKDGRLIETIEQDGETYLAVSFEKAKGVLAEELPFEVWDETLVQKLGAAAGVMHALANPYIPASEALKRPAWDQAGNCYHPGETLDPSQAGVQEVRSKIVETVRLLPREVGSFGMIHADFHGGNFYVDVESRTITVFDFDDCCYGWYAMDIAMSLFDILVLYDGQDPQRFGDWFLENYLRGYSGENRLSPIWIERLPLFLKLLETGVYTQVHRFYAETGGDFWVGKFMAGRKERIEREIPYVDLDFSGLYRRALAKTNPPAG